jgi:hypothetical protein
MKKIAMFLFFVAACVNVPAQKCTTCLPEGIAFNQQYQIDEFHYYYPGCTEIEGDVYIVGSSIMNLNGLSMLTSIGGSLIIAYSQLVSLTALGNLTHIGGSLEISNNSLLATCNTDWICDYLANPNGSVFIAANKTGCNSVVELSSACGGIPCLPYGHYYFTSQTDIDNFALAFPDCNDLEGNIFLFGTDIFDLNGLNEVNSFAGDFHVENTYLNNLTGLGGLTEIGGDFRIDNNPGLIDLTGLEGLISIEGKFFIQSNEMLTDISGADNLNAIGGGLNIVGNSTLSFCDAGWLCAYLSNPGGTIYISGNAPGCRSVIELANACGGNIPCLPYGDYCFFRQSDIDDFQQAFPVCSELQGYVLISGNDIRNLYGLNSINSINGSLTITNNDSLTSLEGMENLAEIAHGLAIGDMYSEGNPQLISLTGLQNLTSVGGQVLIANNPVSSLDGLENLLAIGYGFIIHNISILNMAGLEHLTTIGGELKISYCDSLESMTGLNQLNSIGGLMIENCHTLADLSGLDSLNIINGLCKIAVNDALISLSGLENLDSIYGTLSIGAMYGCGEVYPEGNPQLSDLNAISNLKHVGGGIGIYGNHNLVDLSGLENIAALGGDLIINENASLMNLSGFETLKTIGGDLMIVSNNSLNSLSGLDSIEAGSISDLYIQTNQSLSTCEVKSICDYLAAPNGTIEISNNAPGCNSLEEVEEACLVGVGQLDGWTVGQLPVIVYPNPVSEIVHLEFEIPNSGPVRIQIFNVVGKMVADLSDGILAKGQHQITWNVADLPAGMYICKVQMGQELVARKIVKQ